VKIRKNEDLLGLPSIDVIEELKKAAPGRSSSGTW
jgi:hypothetical protein